MPGTITASLTCLPRLSFLRSMNTDNVTDADGPSSPSQRQPQSSKHTIQSCLRKLLRVNLKDGRIVEGILECYDNHSNMVLSGATDISSKGTSPFGRTIRLGMVMVPGDATEKVLAWREKYVDTGEIVERAPEPRQPDIPEGAIGEDSDDELEVITEGFEGMHVGT